MTFDQSGTQPRQQLLDTVRAAIDAGVTLFDTADAYGPGDELGADAQGANEVLVAGLLDELGVRDQVLLATKGGHVRTEGGGWGTDSSAAHLHEAVDASLGRLGVEQIALWQHHRPDPAVPYDDVIGTLKEIADSGKVAQDRPLQRRPGPDPMPPTPCSGDAAGQRAEPVLAGLPQQRPRDRGLRGARPGLPAVEPAGRPG